MVSGKGLGEQPALRKRSLTTSSFYLYLFKPHLKTHFCFLQEESFWTIFRSKV